MEIIYMKVKITNSDYRHRGKLIREGQTIDVDKQEYESNQNILIPVADETQSTTKSKSKKK